MNTKTKPEKTEESIKVVDRALYVLDLLRDERKGLGVNQIAKRCGFPASTTFRILKTLELRGWVFQLSDDTYITGEKLSFVLEKNNLFLALKDVASFVMDRYSKKHNVAMNLLVRESSRCFVLQQSRTINLLDYVPPLYSELPFYASAGGKILYSDLPNGLLDEFISSSQFLRLAKNTITDPELIREELQQVAELGYGIDFNESAENGSCIAVPVRDPEGNVLASLSFSGFIGITDKSKLLEFLPALNEAASEISQKLFRYWESDN